MQDAFPALGITRLGRLTGLDSIGIPVWMAVRPNAENLSVTQGKGLDDTAAALSAIMEAAELALAEAPHPRRTTLSGEQAAAQSQVAFDARRYLRLGQSTPASESQAEWVPAFDLLSERSTFVPAEIVGLLDRPGLTYWQASDGLGAGGSLAEAAVHALCELIERDAMGLWSFRSLDAMVLRERDPHGLADAGLSSLAERIAQAGLSLRLFDITSDIEVPAFLATVAPAGRTGLRYLDLASGSGAHPLPARAAQRAVLEAAQTRLTTIAGARDDIAPGTYDQPLPPQLAFYAGPPAPRHAGDSLAAPAGIPRPAPLLLTYLLDRLRTARIDKALLVSFEAETLGFSACRMLVPGLEQDSGTRNRRLGRRAIRAMMGGQ